MRLLEQPVETSRGVFPVTELSVAGFQLLLAAEARGIETAVLSAVSPCAAPFAERLTEGDLAKIMAAARLNPDLFQGTAGGFASDDRAAADDRLEELWLAVTVVSHSTRKDRAASRMTLAAPIFSEVAAALSNVCFHPQDAPPVRVTLAKGMWFKRQTPLLRTMSSACAGSCESALYPPILRLNVTVLDPNLGVGNFGPQEGRNTSGLVREHQPVAV